MAKARLPRPKSPYPKWIRALARDLNLNPKSLEVSIDTPRRGRIDPITGHLTLELTGEVCVTVRGRSIVRLKEIS
jgi:hypothetical protein